jgi:O-antigen ligase
MNGKTTNYIKSKTFIITKDLQVFEWLNKSIPVLMGVLIFFNPFPHITAVKEICFYLSVFIVISLFLFKKNDISFETPFLIPVGLFFIWTFLGLFFALDKNNSIHDFYAHFIRYILIYYILINYFKSKKSVIGLSWIIIVSSSIFSITAIYYHYFILENALTQRFTGFIQVPVSVIGVMSAVAAIFCINNFFNEIKLYRKLILIICFFSVFFLIALSQTLSTFIAFCLAIIILFFNNKKILIAVSVVISIICIVTPFKNRIVSYSSRPSIGLRVGIDYAAFEVFKDYPIIGIGFGMETFGKDLDLKKYNERVPEKYRENYIYNDPHNMFFDIAVRLGIVGFVLFLYIIFIFFKICWNIIKDGKDDFAKNWGRCLAAAFFSFLFIGFFHPIFSHKPETILCTMFFMLTIVRRLDKEPISKGIA